MPKRLFIGLELPEAIRSELAALDPCIKGLRWLPEEQMHLTMSFLGDVEADAELRLRDALSGVRLGEFFLPVKGVASRLGGSGARPTVVWAGVGKGHPHLFALHKHIQDAVLHAGLEADLRPYGDLGWAASE